MSGLLGVYVLMSWMINFLFFFLILFVLNLVFIVSKVMLNVFDWSSFAKRVNASARTALKFFGLVLCMVLRVLILVDMLNILMLFINLIYVLVYVNFCGFVNFLINFFSASTSRFVFFSFGAFFCIVNIVFVVSV